MENTAYPRRVGLLIFTLLIPLQLQAAVYQWTDEHGRVQFSDRPVHESATEVKIRTSPGSPQDSGLPQDRRAKQQRMLDIYGEERAAKKEQAEKDKQARDERKRKCLNARARYDEYSHAGSIYDYLESGERKYLDKEQRSRFIAGIKADVEKYCD
jgi:catalase